MTITITNFTVALFLWKEIDLHAKPNRGQHVSKTVLSWFKLFVLALVEQIRKKIHYARMLSGH